MNKNKKLKLKYILLLLGVIGIIFFVINGKTPSLEEFKEKTEQEIEDFNEQKEKSFKLVDKVLKSHEIKEGKLDSLKILLKESKNLNEKQKEDLNNKIKDIKLDLKREKNNYNTEEDYFVKLEYKDIKKGIKKDTIVYNFIQKDTIIYDTIVEKLIVTDTVRETVYKVDTIVYQEDNVRKIKLKKKRD